MLYAYEKSVFNFQLRTDSIYWTLNFLLYKIIYGDEATWMGYKIPNYVTKTSWI